MIGISALTCQADATWSGNAPTCTRKECPLLTAPANGGLTGFNFYQDVAQFTCDSGYDMIGNPALTCQADATWDGTPPTCTRKECPLLTAPANGAMTGFNFYQDVVDFTCDSGYDMIGVSALTCQADATWDAPAPTCTRKECPLLTAPANGGLTGFNFYQDVAQFTCDSGYDMIGNPALTCQADATWDGTPPTCTRVQCPLLAAPTNGTMTGDNFYQDIARFTCISGYDRVGTASLTCQADRTWNGIVPTCTRVECPVLIAPANGEMTGFNFYNDVMEFTCDSGYDLVGSVSLTCQFDRTWDGVVPTCTHIDECADANAGCDHVCTNTIGTFQCSCVSGYNLNADDFSCDDTNECFTANGGCDQTCSNTIGSFFCSCGSGYSLNGNGFFCDDVNECSSANGGCQHTCTNTIGSFQCSCQSGYSLNGNGLACDDVDECATGNGGCEQTCSNNIPYFQCSCNVGYSMNANGFSCDDVNECVSANGGCEQNCINNIGSFQCSCVNGYNLNANGLGCDDIDECETTNGGCGQFCNNSIGNFSCYCATGYSLSVNRSACDGFYQPSPKTYFQSPGDNNATVSSLFSGVQYSISVHAFGLWNDSANANIECITGLPPPTNISLSLASLESVTVHWAQPARTLVLGYRARLTDKETLSITSRHLPQTASSATFTSLAPATEYVVAVSCVSAFFEGPENEVTIVTETDPPLRLFLDDIRYERLALFWTPPVAKLTGYELTFGSTEQRRKRSAPPHPTTFNITKLTPTTKYIIRIAAISMYGSSDRIEISGSTVAVAENSIRESATSATRTTESHGFRATDAFWFTQLYTAPPHKDSTRDLKPFRLELLETTTMSATTVNSYDSEGYHTFIPTLTILQAIKRLKSKVGRSLEEDTSSENVINIVTEIHNLFELDEFPMSSSDFLVEMEAAVELFCMSSDLIRASQGATISTMETVNDHYELKASTVSCLSWEYTSEKWGSDDCGVFVDLSNSAIRCNCSFPRPKAVIGGSVHFPPNSIDFDTIFGNPNILSENNIVFYVVVFEWALYLLLLIILNVDFQRLRDKSGGSTDPNRKKQLEQLSILPPDRMPAPYLYQITVNSGSMFGAGTSAQIGLQVFGSKCKTAVKTLNPGGASLLRGGSYDFVMPMKEPLGHLELLHIWHDNAGGGDTASWFLRDIIVKDMQTDTTYQFVCYDWLSDVRGDGEVQKVLHAATVEQLQSFNTLLRENTDAMFYDQHLWTSPVVSPEGSSFSKAERLSCCLAIANIMMLASAMWYRDDNDDSITNIVYNLGFVQFTLQELYVSLVTTVVVIPVTVIPVLLFRKEIPVPVTAPGIQRSNDQSGTRLSRWPKYVAWLIVVVVSIASSFFVIMYGLDWGKEKSEAWLKSFFLSFCLSSLVVETGQIFLLALLAALVCNPTPSSKQRTYNIKRDELRLHLLGRNAPKKVYPPRAASVQRMKTKNEQRQKFVLLLKDYSVLLLFVVVLFFIGQQDKDPYAFHASQTLSGRLTEDFDSITTPEDFWTWTEEILLPVLYPSFWYNGWKMKYLDRQFPIYTESFRVGPPRLTQLREAPDTMELDDFQNGWVVASKNSSCWHFNVTGMVTYNPDCISEYSMELPIAITEATTTLSDLQRNHWIDKYTRHLTLELSFYYPSRKLFSSLKMTVQRDGIGHLSTSTVVGTHRLFQYQNISDYGVMAAHILFLLLFFICLLKEGIDIKKEGIKFFGSVWNLMASFSILGSFAVICAFGIRYHFASAALGKIVEATGELGIDHFIDFGSAFWWDDALKYVLAALVFVNTLTILRMVKFNKTIAHFLALPGVMKKDLAGFSIISAIAFMAFSSSGMVVFGTHMKAFSNVIDTNLALFEMLLGSWVVDEILEANRYVGPVYFSMFMICIFILLVNFLVTIICDAIALGDSIDDDYDQDLVDYIWTSLKEMLGIRSPPTTEETTGEEKLSELKANLQKMEDSLDDTLDVTKCLWPNIKSTEDVSFSHDDTPRHHPTVVSPDTCDVINEKASSPATPSVSDVHEQVQSLFKAHEDDAARLKEVHKESRRRAEAMLKRKLAARGRISQLGSGGQKQTIVDTAQDLMDQHAAEEARLERRQRSARRLFESKLRQKLAARRVNKKDDVM
ncbi:CSMD1 [Branchiostoma lanceolatum]|uniref:CSMD1 protein n=1 Tax=Branchiostoma lanceolatum TaxID=7740 RepID=A0A8K0EGF0_BRALA|nr:CSMD1 [Branchiostoma lanceolatum]